MNEEMDEVEEMKKFEQGVAYKFEVDSRRVLDWINAITVIHNQITDKENFLAGFNLCLLQNEMIKIHKQLDLVEKKKN